jgi:hypothetical protein
VTNESGGDPAGPFSELLRLQTEFQARLTEETLRYLRRLQGASAPATPSTVLLPGQSIELRASGSPNSAVVLTLEIENRQRMHCLVTPMLSPLVAASGVTWFPESEPSPASLLLAPEEIAPLSIELRLPTNLPPDVYRGALLLQGYRQGSIAVTIEVKGGLARKPKSAAPAEGTKSAANGRQRARRAGKAPSKRKPSKAGGRA